MSVYRTVGPLVKPFEWKKQEIISCKPFEALYFGTLIKYSKLKAGLCQVRILSSKVNITAFANEDTKPAVHLGWVEGVGVDRLL